MIELQGSLFFSGVVPALLGLLLFGCHDPAPPPLRETPGPTRELNPALIGANGNLTTFDHPWEDPQLLAAFRDLGARNLRYPAGTIGNYWDWDIGWIDQDVPDSLMIKWVVENGLRDLPNRYPLEDLARLHRATGTVPVFMLNMLSKDLEHSRRNLRRARDLGLPVRYVELGNELYFDIPFPKLRFPTPEDYGRTCREWIDTLRREFPAARFAVVGTDMNRHARQRDWTRRVLAECPNADAVTFHRYAPAGLDGRRSKRYGQPGTEGTGDPGSVTRRGPSGGRARQLWERELLDDSRAYANLLTSAERNAAHWEAFGIPENLAVWATEFNMRDDSSVVLHGWAHALLLSLYFDELYRAPIELACVHNLVGPTFGLLHQDENGLRHRRDEYRTSVPYSLTGGGVITSLFARASAGAARVTPLGYPEGPVLRDDRDSTFASVRGWRFSGAAERGLFINYGLRPVRVARPAAFSAHRTTVFSAPIARAISGWADVDSTEQVPEAILTLPPRAVVLLTP